MIPKICANCEWGANIKDAQGQIAVVICSYMPLSISEYPNYSCGCFKMAENPELVYEQNEPGPFSGPEGESPNEG